MSIEQDDTPVVNAIETGDVRLVAKWIASRPRDAPMCVCVPGVREPFSPLVLAARVGRIDIVEMFLQSGVSINDRDFDGETAVHAATDSGHLTVVEWLIEQGADLSLRDERQRTALGLAIDMHKEPLVIALIRAGAPLDLGPNCLCRAAAMSPMVLMLLIERGLNVRELRGSDGRTPLHHAAYSSDCVEIFQLLVGDCGVDLDARNGRGNTCVNVCAFYNHHATLRLLISAGANIDLPDEDGNTPLHNTCYANSVRCALVLLAAGADVNAANIANETPCSLASQRSRSVDVFHALLAAGADFDAVVVDSNGRWTFRGSAAFARPFHMHHHSDAPVVAETEIDLARRRIASAQLEFVRDRAFQVCVGLQPLGLDALQTCEILQHACGPVARCVPFHRWWQIATMVKHHQTRSKQR
jgi:ankyrin repeat protein